MLSHSAASNRAFQSTLPRRERQEPEPQPPVSNLFQSTLPRRERPGHDLRPAGTGHFNPRSREGSDRLSQPDEHRRYYFNPRSREGSDDAMRTDPCAWRHFNPRSREGSDVVDVARRGRRAQFQSTLPRRERQQKSPRLFPMIFAK